MRVQLHPAVLAAFATIWGPFAPLGAAAGEVVWQLGSFGDGSAEFEAIPSPDAVYRIVAPGAAGAPIPKQLSTRQGCRRVVLEFDLGRGVFEFLLGFQEPDEAVVVWPQVFFDDRELATWFAAPLSRVAPASGDPPHYQVIRFPLVSESRGMHRLRIVLNGYPDAGELALDALALVPASVNARDHGLRAAVPGQVFLDAWGWMGTTWYQRATRADWKYFATMIVGESQRWGANYVQVHPTFVQGQQWQGIEPARLMRLIHEHSMIVDEHCFSPPDQRKSAPGQVAWMSTWGGVSGNAVERGWMSSVDGFEGEAFVPVFEDSARMSEMVDTIWRFNPGLWISHAAYPGPRWFLQPKYRPPNYIHSPVCMNYLNLKLESEGGNGNQFVGYDDKVPVRPYASDGVLHPPAGKIFYGYQADCRISGTPIKGKDPKSLTGGGSYADWVLKQTDDFFRPRARRPEDPHETAIWWLGEPPDNLPLDQRNYVYAITQDPIKRALAASFGHSGRGGYLDHRLSRLTRQAERENVDLSKVHLWKLRPRSAFQASDHFLQNAYLRLILPPRDEAAVFEVDPERLAHFDSDSLRVTMTRSLIRHLGPAPPGAKTVRVVERGGHLASLEEQFQNEGCRELRRFSLVNDAPYLVLELRREGSGCVPGRYLLGAENQTLLSAAGRQYRRAARFAGPRIPEAFLLGGSPSPLPSVAVLLLDRTAVASAEWTPGVGLDIESAAGRALRLAWVLPDGLYRDRDLPLLASRLSGFVKPVRLTGNGETSLEPDAEVSCVYAARIGNPRGGPYLVRENGWWTARGAQISADQRSDLVKFYSVKGDRPMIRPFGFIHGAVKPGYGNQYALAIGDVNSQGQDVSVSVRVLSVTPILFAPRVEFSQAVREASINGEPWSYVDGRLVFLPNRVGTYHLKVRYGERESAALLRTFAAVTRCRSGGNRLELTAASPPWTTSDPPSLRYYAFIRPPQGRPQLARIQGGEIVSRGRDLLTVGFKPGTSVQLEFAAAGVQ